MSRNPLFVLWYDDNAIPVRKIENTPELPWNQMRTPMKGVDGLSRNLLSFDEIFDPKGDKLCPGNFFTIDENGTNENLSSKSKIHQSCHETQRTHEGEWARYLNRRQLMRTSTSSEISCVPESYVHPLMRCQHTHAIEFGKNTYYRVCDGRMQVN